MKETLSAICAVAVFCAFVAVPANATLTVIGTATYDGTDYNLVWDDDNGGGQDVVYLDYDYSDGAWVNHPDAIAWAQGLDAALTINLLPGYSVTWSGSWRLPYMSPNELYDLDEVEPDTGTVFNDWALTNRYWVNNSPTGHIYDLNENSILQHDNPDDYDNGCIAVRSVSEVIITETVPTLKFESAASGDLESVTPAELTVLLVSPEEGQSYTVDYAAVGGTATAGEDYIIAGGGPVCWNYPTQCHGDSDDTGDVKGSDFLDLKNSWYACDPDANYNPCADFDHDGCVKGSDFLILKSNWYQTVEANCLPEGGPATLVFAPGETTKTISIDIIDDGLDEEDETILVELLNPSGPNAVLGEPNQHTYTIRDPRPEVFFGPECDSSMEDVSPVSITVNLSFPTSLVVTVDYEAIGGTATNGDDYVLDPGTLTFNVGQTSKTINIVIVDDGIDEENETIVITLYPHNAKPGIPSECIYTIIDPSQLHLKVDLGLPICLGGGTGVYGNDTPVPGTVKEGWWGRVFWGDEDMYMHDFAWEDGSRAQDPPDTEGVDGSGVHFALDSGVGDGGYHIHGMCRCNLAGGCCPTGSPDGEPIANGWFHNIDWGGECTGDIHMRITDLPPGRYELISYHNHWEPCSQETRNCLNCYSNMPPLTAVYAMSLPVAGLPGCGVAWSGTGTGVTSLVAAYNIDVTSVLTDADVATSTIEFETDGSDVLVVYEGGDNTYPDPARPNREGHKGVLNAFEIISVGP